MFSWGWISDGHVLAYNDLRKLLMTDKEAPAQPAKGSQTKPAQADKPKPAPARPHMVNDHDEHAINRGKTRIDERSKE